MTPLFWSWFKRIVPTPPPPPESEDSLLAEVRERIERLNYALKDKRVLKEKS